MRLRNLFIGLSGITLASCAELPSQSFQDHSVEDQAAGIIAAIIEHDAPIYTGRPVSAQFLDNAERTIDEAIHQAPPALGDCKDLTFDLGMMDENHVLASAVVCRDDASFWTSKITITFETPKPKGLSI